MFTASNAEPVASRLMASACRIGTPLASIVPRMRQKRVMETIFSALPATGILSRQRSIACLPAWLWRTLQKKAITPTNPAMRISQWLRNVSLMKKTTSVGSGLSTSASIGSNLGTKKISAPIMTSVPINTSMVGYTRAPSTLLRRSSRRSRKTDRLDNTSSRKLARSPACTITVCSVGKIS